MQDYTDMPINGGASEHMEYRYKNTPKDINLARKIVSQGSNRSKASSKNSRKLRNAIDR